VKVDVAVADWQKTFDEAMSQGYRPKATSSYRIGNADFNTALFDKGASGPWASRTGASPGSYRFRSDRYLYQGLRPVWLTVFASGNTQRTNIFWEASPSFSHLGAINSRMQD